MKRLNYLCLVSLLFVSAASTTRADIFQWEYINPANPDQGKQQSATLAPDGAGVDAVPGANLSNRNLTMAFLRSKVLTNANLMQSNLTNVDFSFATITGADFTDAVVQGARFFASQGASGTQLYSTASYKAHDLTGIGLGGIDLSGADLAGQNLTGADFSSATLNSVNFAGAEIRGASFYRDGTVGGSGINAGQLSSTASYQTHDLTGINLGGNYLAGANLSGQNLTNADLTGVTLSRANLFQANLNGAKVTGANFDRVFDTTTPVCNSGGCFNFYAIGYGGITPAQLFATTTYQALDLTGIHLEGNDLTNADLHGQNLTRADFTYATLTGANFSGAEIRGADFGRYWFSTEAVCANFGLCTLTTGIIGSGITLDQLGTTKSYQAHDLTGINFGGNNLAGANLAGQNLTNAYFGGSIDGSPGANLTGADLWGADARGAGGLGGYGSPNLIWPDGHVAGLDLGAGQMLSVRDYDGNSSGTIPITVDQHFAMASGGTLRLIFEADAWDSTLSFAGGIPVTRGGTLELSFADGVNVAAHVGRTFKLFDWTGVSPAGDFDVSSPYGWNLSNLYTTGEVTLAAIPEPSTLLLLCFGSLAVFWRRRRLPHRTSQQLVNA